MDSGTNEQVSEKAVNDTDDRYTGLASKQALAFVDANPVDPGPGPTGDTVDQWRTESAGLFRPRAERALDRFSLTPGAVTIAGVPCLEIVPEGCDPDHLVLYFYGGGYVTGSAYEDLIVSAALASFARARIIAPEYRLAPENPWPAATTDGFAVFEALAIDLNGRTLAIAGESAGGNLALAVMLRARDAGLPMPHAAALLSPWCDLANGGDSVSGNDGRDPTLTRRFLDAYTKLYAGDNHAKTPDISPLHGTYDSSFPPMFVTTGTRDLLMSQCVRLAQVLRNAGVDVDLRIWDGLWHVFEFYDELPEAEQSLRTVAAFLHRQYEASIAQSPA